MANNVKFQYYSGAKSKHNKSFISNNDINNK